MWSAAIRFGSAGAFNRLWAELHHGVDILPDDRVVLSLNQDISPKERLGFPLKG
jgi:hypothetical protein